MTDVADRAQALEELQRAQALDMQAAKPAMPFTGGCYNCREPIGLGCFCDRDCRDDYERRESRVR